jgi:hypothetical protein
MPLPVTRWLCPGPSQAAGEVVGILQRAARDIVACLEEQDENALSTSASSSLQVRMGHRLPNPLAFTCTISGRNLTWARQIEGIRYRYYLVFSACMFALCYPL